MRISDWSSDVCSSDLWLGCRTDSAVISNGATKKMEYAVDSGNVRKAYTNAAIIRIPSAPRSRCNGQRTRSSGPIPVLSSAHASSHGSDEAPRSAATWNGGECAEIGRAQVRERGCE